MSVDRSRRNDDLDQPRAEITAAPTPAEDLRALADRVQAHRAQERLDAAQLLAHNQLTYRDQDHGHGRLWEPDVTIEA